VKTKSNGYVYYEKIQAFAIAHQYDNLERAFGGLFSMPECH